jgi:hypothetical protein
MLSAMSYDSVLIGWLGGWVAGGVATLLWVDEESWFCLLLTNAPDMRDRPHFVNPKMSVFYGAANNTADEAAAHAASEILSNIKTLSAVRARDP